MAGRFFENFGFEAVSGRTSFVVDASKFAQVPTLLMLKFHEYLWRTQPQPI